MSDQPPNQYAAEPLTQLPLNGSYGGKPKRISIEFDDYSSRHIGNADGSVDIIFANLAKYYAEPLQSDDQNFTITESKLNNRGDASEGMHNQEATKPKADPSDSTSFDPVQGPSPANSIIEKLEALREPEIESPLTSNSWTNHNYTLNQCMAIVREHEADMYTKSSVSIKDGGKCIQSGGNASGYSGESSTGSVTIGPGPTTICQKCMLRMESCQCGNQREYSATLFDPNRHCDAQRVIVWIDNPERKAANTAFTEGLERQIAYRFESASDRATVRPGEMRYIGDEGVLIALCEELADTVKEGRPYLGSLAAKLRPLLRTTEPAPATESSENFDPVEARKELTPEEQEIVKRPIVQSLLYDLNLLPEQITKGKHWFYMLSIMAHMDQASKPKPVVANEIRDTASGDCAGGMAAVGGAADRKDAEVDLAPLNTPYAPLKPVLVELEKCADAVYANSSYVSANTCRNIARAVLDAAGVKYVE